MGAPAAILRGFLAVAPEELARIDAAVVRAFLEQDSQLSPATRRRRHASLSAFFRWLVQQELVDFNPVDRVPASYPNLVGWQMVTRVAPICCGSITGPTGT